MADEEVLDPISNPKPNTDIEELSGFTWSFFPIDSGDTESEIHQDNKRYAIASSENPVLDRTEYSESEMKIATSLEYESLINDESTTYLRVEISSGGRSTRTNFHDDCLLGQHVFVNGFYHEIVGQEGGNIIDVSILDVTQKHKFDPLNSPNYVIYNQFAWKTDEWYMSNSRTKFLEGTITKISGNSITVNTIAPNSATLHEQRYFNHGSRESISFFDRFIDEYDHDIDSFPRKVYSKFKGWYQLNSSGSAKYAIVDISTISVGDRVSVGGRDGTVLAIDEVTSSSSGSSSFVITLSEPPEDFAIGDSVYSLFDKEPYPRKSSFNGQYNVAVSDVRAGTNLTESGTVSLNNTSFACMDGYWLSPIFNVIIPNNATFGLCGGRYWGLGDRAPDNDNALVFMRATELGGIGIASSFDWLKEEDWVVYYDAQSQLLTSRRGVHIFQDKPIKQDIIIGEPSLIQDAAVSSEDPPSISLDATQDRTQAIFMGVPRSSDALYFTIGNTSDYYGFAIAGKGEMSLVPLERLGVEQNPEDYTDEDDIVSPVFIYMNGDYSRYSTPVASITVGTEEGPVFVHNLPDGSSIGDASVQYVNKNQVINDATFFDLHAIDDGEMLLVMGRPIPEFKVDNEGVTKNSNSSSDGTSWENTSNGVILIGTKDTGNTWRAPVFDRLTEDHQYSLLVLNEVDYCCSIYDELSGELSIFVKCYQDGELFFGVFIVNLLHLGDNNFLCTPVDDSQPFLWRALELSDEFVDDPSLTYADSQVEDNFSFPVSNLDEFHRIASLSPSLGADVVLTGITDMGVITSYELDDGTRVLFYDAISGVKMLWSNDSGRSWNQSMIIIARDATAGYGIAGILIYILTTGLESKIVSDSALNLAMSASEGSSEEFIESIQEQFDNFVTTPLGTGPVPTQKLSGYIDDLGIMRVFYYDIDNKLCSTTGTSLIWEFTNNF